MSRIATVILIIWSFLLVPGFCLAGVFEEECAGECTGWGGVPHRHQHNCPHDPCRILTTIRIDNRREEPRRQTTNQQVQTYLVVIVSAFEVDLMSFRQGFLPRERGLIDLTRSIAHFQPLLI